MASLHLQYIDDIKSERGKLLSKKPALFQPGEIGWLPGPVKRYLRACRYLGTPKRLYAQLQWNNVRFKLSRSAKWRPIRCDEFLAVPEPLRIAHMTMRRGLLPIEARDKYQQGHGNMLVKLGSIIRLADVKGKEIDQSELVTILAEAPLLPAFLLEPYIHWTETGAYTASATIAYNGVAASGTFFFNERDEFVRFETEDRWETQGRKKFRQTRWQATAGDYVDDGGIRRPKTFAAAWLDGEQTFEYFKGELAGIA